MVERHMDRVRELVERFGEIANRDVANALRVSPSTSHRILRALIEAGTLEAHGRGRAARYRFPSVRRRFPLKGLEEDRVWQAVKERIARVRRLTDEEARALQYAATEIINNAIEHSDGRWLEVTVRFTAEATTALIIRDDGVGVFRRVCEDFAIRSPQHAIVQLEKGKLTSDPRRHSGEGLFFSSKAVTRFRLESQRVAWIVDNLIGDSAIGNSDFHRGTRASLAIVAGRTPRLEDVFEAYTNPETLRFDRTRTTVKLGALGAALMSRSEARRIVERLTSFNHAVLDFSGVEVVGQGFCDEVFRVFARAHPDVALEPVAMNDAVAFMVRRARSAPP